jgi:hypothetical protein
LKLGVERGAGARQLLHDVGDRGQARLRNVLARDRGDRGLALDLGLLDARTGDFDAIQFLGLLRLHGGQGQQRTQQRRAHGDAQAISSNSFHANLPETSEWTPAFSRFHPGGTHPCKETLIRAQAS